MEIDNEKMTILASQNINYLVQRAKDYVSWAIEELRKPKEYDGAKKKFLVCRESDMPIRDITDKDMLINMSFVWKRHKENKRIKLKNIPRDRTFYIALDMVEFEKHYKNTNVCFHTSVCWEVNGLTWNPLVRLHAEEWEMDDFDELIISNSNLQGFYVIGRMLKITKSDRLECRPEEFIRNGLINREILGLPITSDRYFFTGCFKSNFHVSSVDRIDRCTKASMEMALKDKIDKGKRMTTKASFPKIYGKDRESERTLKLIKTYYPGLEKVLEGIKRVVER